MSSLSTHILFLTTHPLNSPHRNWNLELLNPLAARSIPTSTLSLLADQTILTPQHIAETYTHVSFLLLGEYPPHHAKFSAFIKHALLPATKLNPRLRVINGPRIAEWNSDKVYLRELNALGIPVPKTSLLDVHQPLDVVRTDIQVQSAGNAIVIKPSVSASGARTHLIRNPAELGAEDVAFLEELMRAALDESGANASGEVGGSGRSESFMLQEYIPEIKDGEMSLCYVGGELLYAILKRPRPDGWLSSAGFGAAYSLVDDADVPEDAKRIAEKVFKYVEEKFGESVDYARVDGIVRGNGGFVVMEIELIEPSLFLDHESVGKRGTEALCDQILKR